MRLDEFSIPDGRISTADIARMLLFGFDIVLNPPPAVDLSTAVIFSATKKSSVTNSVTQKTSLSYGVTRKGAITIDQLQGGNR